MRLMTVAALSMMLSAGCAKSNKPGSPVPDARVLKGLSGRFVSAQPAESCPKCLMFVCPDVGKDFPFLGPQEAEAKDNPNPVPVAFNPKHLAPDFQAGDFVIFDLAIDWNSNQPLMATAMKFVKHGMPGIGFSCPDIAE